METQVAVQKKIRRKKKKLTAVSFVGAVGTVSDEVALWVELGETLPTVAGEGAVWTRG